MSKERLFLIFHSERWETTSATDALSALKKTWLPQGFKDATAIIDYACIVGSQHGRQGAALAAFIGQPVAATKGAAKGQR